MTTWSPVATWRANIGLCLPRRTRATSVAMRPSTRPSASTTCQARWMSDGLGENVRTRVLLRGVAELTDSRGCGRTIPHVVTLTELREARDRVEPVLRPTPVDVS